MRKRSLFLVCVPILALVLVVGLISAVRHSAQPPPARPGDRSAASGDAIGTQPATPTAPAASGQVTAQTPPALTNGAAATARDATDGAADLTAADLTAADLTTGDLTAADLVALVNGAALRSDRFALAQAVEEVMAALLGSQAATAAQLVNQMVNHELVMQRMAAAELDSAGPEEEAAARLQMVLAAAGKTEADLAAALAAAGVAPADFAQYFAELLAVDAFARKAAAAQSTDLDAYVVSLQRTARISYGPFAAAALAPAAPAPAAAEPVSNSQTAVSSATPQPAPPATGPPATAAPLTAAPLTAAPAVRGTAAGQLAPYFALTPLGSDGQTAFDDLLGRPLVLSFWTTWCPYCLRQTPLLTAASQRYTNLVNFVGIDVAEDARTVAAYAAEHAIPYPILLDRESRTAADYAVNGFPTTYFLDASGHVVAQHIGSLSEDQITQYVEQLLASHP